METPEEKALMQRFETLEMTLQDVKGIHQTKFKEWTPEIKLYFMKELERLGFFQVVQVVKEVIVERPLKTPPAQLERVREQYYLRKEEAKEKQEQDRQALKIVNAIKRRTKFFCFRCGKKIEVDIKKTTHTLKVKEGKTRFILENKCPLCLNQVKEFGGVLN
jgi:glycerol-3-phosphate cytidylyltransferase-like family protein